MKQVILLSPINTNGGIASWTKKFLSTFPDDEFKIHHVIQDMFPRQLGRSFWTRFKTGIVEVRHIKKCITNILKENKIDIIHTTSSGSLGAWRDYCVAKLCHKNHIPCIIHYRIGIIPEWFASSRFWRWAMYNSMKQFDQIWVLDKNTYNCLRNIPQLENKVFLTPNSIEVKPLENIPTKEYKNFLFMAMVLETKGIFEFAKAFIACKDKTINLHICGQDDQGNIEKVKQIVGDLWNNRVFYHGSLSNKDAVKFLNTMDAMVLPTYFWGEAFPISILEAMSLGKLVISTPRAAIKDMLTCEDGTRCGLLAAQKSVEELKDALDWVADHHDKADELCIKAYQKVYNAYRTDVVYEIYRNNYRRLLQ